MTKARDLTGQQFGRLIVIRSTGQRKNGSLIWECRCECGETVLARSSALTSGNSKSCGCARKDFLRKKAKDLTGMQFGRLMVLRSAMDKRKNGRLVWECQCDCGKIAFVRSDSLISGETLSCGCLKKEKSAEASAKDIAGQRFGRLIAICPTDKRQSSSVVWKCQCDCGKTTFVRIDSLTRGDTKSCGCLTAELCGTMAKNTLVHVDGTAIDIIRSKRLNKNNSSGYKGVSLLKNGKYMAYIGFKRKTYWLGTYTMLEDAVAVRKRAEALLHDETVDYYAKWRTKAAADPAWAEENPVEIKVVEKEYHDFSVYFSPVL